MHGFSGDGPLHTPRSAAAGLFAERGRCAARGAAGAVQRAGVPGVLPGVCLLHSLCSSLTLTLTLSDTLRAARVHTGVAGHRLGDRLPR